MTKLLQEALDAVRRLPLQSQDEIAQVMLALTDQQDAVPLSPDEREAIARSKAAAERSEFATEQQVGDVWAKHGL
jgi:hypothetical protein